MLYGKLNALNPLKNFTRNELMREKTRVQNVVKKMTQHGAGLDTSDGSKNLSTGDLGGKKLSRTCKSKVDGWQKT